MKKYFVMAALALSAFAASAGPFLPACNTSTDVEADASACFNMVGNDQGAFTPVTALALSAVFGGGTSTLGSKPWHIVQSFDSGGKTGTLTFADAANGVFAVTLKAGHGYNAYLFDGGVAGVLSISYSIDKNLSHANLWSYDQGDVVGLPAVPEPTTYALMIAGLLGIGFVSYRRKA